jgi:2-keto-4-pentenoate hydratase/2-oxohepta-3-ene-1,7-dioic acid hydratase in catechol pathway
LRISTFQAGEREPAVGLSIGAAVVALHAGAEALGDGAAEVPRDLLGIIEAGPETWELAESFDTTLSECELPAEGQGKWWWQADDVKFEVPFKPRKNPWVVGANYYQHLANGYARIPRPATVPPHPEFFTKALTAMIGDGEDIIYDKRATVTLDYETELCLVIGRGGKDIPHAEGHDHIFGYTAVNDTSARELQIGHRQYFRGKSLDSFCPIGPVIVTPKHIPNPYVLTITTRVNGQVRQQWPVGDMLFKLDELVSVLSEGMTIEPGEMLITGTVPGVGFEQMPQVWLQHLDVVETEISKIGVLRNVVKMRQAEQVTQ